MKVLSSIFACSLLWFSMSAVAPVFATEALDVSVGLKTLPLLKNRITGTINMAIVFDPANPESRADADMIKAFADDESMAPSGDRLIGMKVAVNDLAKLKGAKVVFVAKGVGADGFETVALAAAADGLLSMSTDLACVKAGKCVLGIVTRPTVEIYFSRTAALASNLGFSSSFIMLAKPN